MINILHDVRASKSENRPYSYEWLTMDQSADSAASACASGADVDGAADMDTARDGEILLCTCERG